MSSRTRGFLRADFGPGGTSTKKPIGVPASCARLKSRIWERTVSGLSPNRAAISRAGSPSTNHARNSS